MRDLAWRIVRRGLVGAYGGALYGLGVEHARLAFWQIACAWMILAVVWSMLDEFVRVRMQEAARRKVMARLEAEGRILFKERELAEPTLDLD